MKQGILIGGYLCILTLVMGLFLMGKDPVETTKDTRTIGDSVFNTSQIHEIRIYFNQCNYTDSLLLYRDSLGENHKYLQANMSFDGVTYNSIGIRYKGESSFDYTASERKSFKIKTDQYFKKQKLDGLNTINLNNSFRDPSYLREKLFFDCLNEQGLIAPRCSFAVVYINDKPIGFYQIIEQIDKAFIKKNFPNEKGVLIKGEPNGTLEYIGEQTDFYNRAYTYSNKNDSITRHLINFIKVLNDSTLDDQQYQQQLDTYFDTKSCLKIWAITNLFVNTDAYNMFYPHNYYLFYNYNTKLITWIPYDANYAFCAWSPSLTLQQAEQFNLLNASVSKYKNPLTQKLLNNSVYQKIYIGYIRELITKAYTPTYLLNQIDSLTIKIRKHVYANSIHSNSTIDFERSLIETIGNPLAPGAFTPGLKPFINSRYSSVMQQLKKIK